MDLKDAQSILDTIVAQVFGYKNPMSLEEFRQRFAFDVRLPNKVTDSDTGEVAWASSTNPTKFITMTNARNRSSTDDNLLPKRELNTLRDILAAWNEINFMTTDREIESIGVLESDNVYNSENVYRSQDIHFAKNILYCDGVNKSEYIAASQRSTGSVYSIRIDDAKECSQSFTVSWSGKISKSFFIHNSYDLSDCMFCTNIASKRFCIANMQFDEAEYARIRDLVVRWILTGKE